jgi:protein TonB
MFEDSLMESKRHLSKRRGWTTLLSSGLQILVLAILVVIPLLHTDAITAVYNATVIPAPLISPAPSTGSQPPPGRTSGGARPLIEVRNNYDPNHRIIVGPEPVGPTPIDVQNCKKCGTLASDAFSTGPSTGPVLAAEKPKGTPPVSVLKPGQILQRVEPVYPPLARTTRTQGTVILQAIISRDGVIEQLQLISGHPLLAPAAIDAVRQWRFRPYILNGQPIEVETEITVNFTLGS